MRVRSSHSPDKRTVNISPPLWQALKIVAASRHTSISEVLREAGEKEVARYGLTFVDGELTVHPSLWRFAEISEGEVESAGEEI
jgi:hypothetical protein